MIQEFKELKAKLDLLSAEIACDIAYGEISDTAIDNYLIKLEQISAGMGNARDYHNTNISNH